jgi:hypothetical protein
MKDGTALALGVIGVVAAASALARRGSSNAPTLTQLQQRMLRMWNQYPEQTAWRAQQVVDAVLFPRADSYLRDAEGWAVIQDDIKTLSDKRIEGLLPAAKWATPPASVSSYFRNMIKDGGHWSEIAWVVAPRYPATHPIEPLIPWIAKEVNRITKRLPSITVRERDFNTRASRKEFEVSVEDVRRLIEARKTTSIVGGVFVFASGVSIGLPRRNISIPFGPIPTTIDTKSAEDVIVTWHLKKLLKSLPQIIDWYSSGEAGDLMPMTYEQAIKGEKKWHRALAAAAPARGQRASTQGTTVITMASPRGWTIRELAPSDLRPQSDAMGHCVGKSTTYSDMISRGEGKIYSVRDEQGRSVFTVQVKFNPTPRIVQFKGDGNRVPGLNKRKTGELPSAWMAVDEDMSYPTRVRAWIDRAKKPFVLRDDAEAAAAATRELKRLYGGLTWSDEGDLAVPIALDLLD